MDGGQGHQGELTPGQQVLSSLPTGGAPRTYVMNSTNKHKVSRARYLTSNDPRGYIPVYEYPVGDQWIMLDAEDGYVLWTAIWKALGNAKADVVRMLDNMPELTPHIRRVRGGYLKIQGTWMKYEIAEDFARRVAYNIREDLIPLFGPNFPASCLTPDQPGFGNILPGGRRRKARASTSRKAPSSKASDQHANEDYHPAPAPVPAVGMAYPEGPPSQVYTSNERASYGGPGNVQAYPGGSPGQPVPHFTQAPMYASQQHYHPPHGQQYYDQIPPAPSDLQQHQNYHPHPEYAQQPQQPPVGTSYYQAGIPSSSGPARNSSTSAANSARQHLPGQLRYDPYGAAAKAHHGGRPGGGEQAWTGGVPTYGRLPQVDYSRVHLSPGGSGWSAGGSGGGRQQAAQANNGVGRGPVVDPSLVGTGNVPVPTSSDRGEGSSGSRGERGAENGDNGVVPAKSSSGRNTPQRDNNSGDSRPPSYGSHSHSSSKQSLGLPISSARDDAGT